MNKLICGKQEGNILAHPTYVYNVHGFLSKRVAVAHMLFPIVNFIKADCVWGIVTFIEESFYFLWKILPMISGLPKWKMIVPSELSDILLIIDRHFNIKTKFNDAIAIMWYWVN